MLDESLAKAISRLDGIQERINVLIRANGGTVIPVQRGVTGNSHAQAVVERATPYKLKALYACYNLIYIAKKIAGCGNIITLGTTALSQKNFINAMLGALGPDWVPQVEDPITLEIAQLYQEILDQAPDFCMASSTIRGAVNKYAGGLEGLKEQIVPYSSSVQREILSFTKHNKNWLKFLRTYLRLNACVF